MRRPRRSPSPLGRRSNCRRELTDPATADKLARLDAGAVEGVARPEVGEVAGRASRAASRRRPSGTLTVRDLARRDDPNFDRNLQRHIAKPAPTIDAEHKAVERRALPAMMKALDERQPSAIERADREYARSDLPEALDGDAAPPR